MPTEASFRLRIGEIWIDGVTFDGALERIDELIARGEGGSVFTPNVDHVVNAGRVDKLRAAYAACSLSLVDGQPLVWASRLLGAPLPEKVSGSDLVPRLLERAVARRHRVYLLGGAAGVAEAAADLLQRRGVEVAGFDGGRISLDPAPGEDDALVERISAARPDLLLVALGSPKQEVWIHRCGARLRPAVCVAVGAALDFITGRVKRAPRWMQKAGLEWLYRLGSEPRRLAFRYLVNDPQILMVLARTLRMPREQRVAGRPRS
jgi:N-acetylglucosaminyldiphosphoundecaprenol N-acetyl-beta-D-mannosaminyltransferase